MILIDYSWGKQCDRTQHPRGITVKLEYQFTFKEYLEASRISTKLETFSEVEFWTRSVLIVGGGIVYIIAGTNPLWGYFIIGFGICYIPIVKFLERRNIMSFDKGFFWVLLFMQIKSAIKGEISLQPFLLIGANLQLVYWLSQFFGLFQFFRWKRTNFWHELVSLQMTESGLELETAKVSILLKWQFYSHFLETKKLFVIYPCEFSSIPHIFPKQAFNREQRQVFRELLYSKIPPVSQV
ncbi:YcxB family protein [Microcoleus sp. S13_C5]|uniref:YcxB family protein n=1 Tax=Microcoleus sp. S13_C5 TaxID=3055411 RepID=UPI002FD07AED